jgi:hypothetical protein
LFFNFTDSFAVDVIVQLMLLPAPAVTTTALAEALETFVASIAAPSDSAAAANPILRIMC